MSNLLTFVLNQEDLFRRARLPSLYSDFTPQRNSNPDGFAANVSTWIEVLERAAKAGLLPTSEGQGHASLTLDIGEALLRALETKEWGRPLALGTAIDEAISQGRILSYERFVKSATSRPRTWIKDPRWLYSWAWEHVKSFGGLYASGSTICGRFVFRANVEEASGTVLVGMPASDRLVDRIYPMRMFREECARLLGLEHGLQDKDLEILLISLARDRGAILYDHEIVKFTLPCDKADTVTAEDTTIASLKSLIEALNMQVKLLSTRIDTSAATARCAVGSNNRTSALAALRSRKLNEITMTQRAGTLFQLEQIYHDLEQAADQVAMIRIMKDSTHLLRNMNAQIGGTEGAEITAGNARDEISNVDEVGTIISKAGQDVDSVDEEEIDEELKELMRQERSLDEVKTGQGTIERLSRAPSVKDVKTQHGDADVQAAGVVSDGAMSTMTHDTDATEDSVTQTSKSLLAETV